MIYPYPSGCLMTVNDLSMALNMPPALKSRFENDGIEVAQKLPPYASVRTYRAMDFEGIPNE